MAAGEGTIRSTGGDAGGKKTNRDRMQPNNPGNSRISF